MIAERGDFKGPGQPAHPCISSRVAPNTPCPTPLTKMSAIAMRNAAVTRPQRASLSRPAAVRRAAVVQRGPARVVTVRAAGSDFDFNKVKDTYLEITEKVPPIVTAATVPVITLSLLCKTLTGSGLPGTFLGSIEGLSYLVFIAGFWSFLPRASAIIQAGDYSPDYMLQVLNDKSSYKDTEDVLGNSATARLDSLYKKRGNSQLGEQMRDIEKARAEKAKETPEERAMKEKLKKELAAKALGVGNTISNSDKEKVEKIGEEQTQAAPVMSTLKECMTTENYDVDVTKFDDNALGDKLNLSSPEIESGAPKNNPGDKWREQYKQK